jgi:hypothetical protein
VIGAGVGGAAESPGVGPEIKAETEVGATAAAEHDGHEYFDLCKELMEVCKSLYILDPISLSLLL